MQFQIEKSLLLPGEEWAGGREKPGPGGSLIELSLFPDIYFLVINIKPLDKETMP